MDPSDGVFGRFDLAALCGCRTLNVCLFVCLKAAKAEAAGVVAAGPVEAAAAAAAEQQHPLQ